MLLTQRLVLGGANDPTLLIPVSDSAWLVTVLLIAFVIGVVFALITLRRRSFVSGTSTAVLALKDLNTRSRTLASPLPPIRLAFSAAASSKARFDRFDLRLLMSESFLENEEWLGGELEARLAATRCFTAYDHNSGVLARESLGRSAHPRVSSERYRVIEEKLFQRGKLKYPAPKAHVTATVTYTSPKGKNSYVNRLTWDFDQLRAGFESAQAARARQSTVQARRQRERSLMTAGMRMNILRRDNFRCRMCGSSAADGISLHVDHIVPVSRGGLTLSENLQVLCNSCNLGKSNKFIG